MTGATLLMNPIRRLGRLEPASFAAGQTVIPVAREARGNRPAGLQTEETRHGYH